MLKKNFTKNYTPLQSLQLSLMLFFQKLTAKNSFALEIVLFAVSHDRKF